MQPKNTSSAENQVNMALRFPGGLTTIKSITDTGTSGTTAYPFLIPQDCDSIVVKLNTGATFTGTNPTCDVYLQTSDDGGTTWYDCANVGQITAAVLNLNARFVCVPVAGASMRGLGNFIGSVAASTTASSLATGLPLLSQYARITVTYGGTQLTNTNVLVKVYANSQASHQ